MKGSWHTCRLWAVALDMLLSYVAFAACRCVFVCCHYQPSIIDLQFVKGSLVFDTSAILYTNSLFILLVLLPFHWKENHSFHVSMKWLFVFVNAVCVVLNMADVVYFGYTGRRTTLSSLRQLPEVDHAAGIIWTECVSHWWLVAIASALIVMLAGCYVRPLENTRNLRCYYMRGVLYMIVVVPLSVIGMRGGLSAGTKPMTVIHALQYSSKPSHAPAIVNTPFALIRTAGKHSFRNPHYLDMDVADSLYTPVHRLSPNGQKHRNVVVLILESFGKEYIGAYNDYHGYTPFLDSLISKSLTFRYSYANGRVSMDGIPAILSGIPMMEESYFLTDASLNKVSGIAGELGKMGYSSAFFHGAENGSMGFCAFARASGFGRYYGMDEFCEDSRFMGEDEFDGKWAIWDEPFLRFSALHISDMREPFMAAVYTATSHHPYVLPEECANDYQDGELPIHKCVSYTDNSLRQFFAQVSGEPWFRNTLFVITADHTNQSCRDEYQTDLGRYEVPIIFYDPEGRVPTGMSDVVAQQTDIMPSVLALTGYEGEFLSYGKNLFSDCPRQWYAGFNNGVYQYIEDDRLLLFDGTRPIALHAYRTDRGLERNLLGSGANRPCDMERRLKAIIQSYMVRMAGDGLTP
ncbi:MAG: LTA synthase family protein [Bacteroidaceae bacterium]|nr:LTA synthase family protein [Bacteroidaceae bacterium]